MQTTTLDKIANAIEMALLRAGIATTVTTHTPDPAQWAGPDAKATATA